MPPRRKSRRLSEPTVLDATEVQFVPDPVEIQPQQAVAAFTGEDNRSDTLVSTIVAAVRTAIQSTSAVQPTNVVEAAVQDDVSQIASGSGGEVLPHSLLFHSIAAFTGEDNRSDTLVSTIVAAVRTAIQSTSAVQPTNVVEAAVQDDVSQIASGSGGEVLPHSLLFHSIAVPLGSGISAKIKVKFWEEEFVDFGSLLDPSPNPDKYSLSFTAPSSGTTKTPQFTFEPVQNPRKVSSINDWVSAFYTFVAIYCVKFPNETPNLMKFCGTGVIMTSSFVTLDKPIPGNTLGILFTGNFGTEQ